MTGPIQALDTISGVGTERILVLGSQLTTDMRDALTKADFNMGIDQVAQLSMTFADPGFRVMSTGLITTGVRVDFEDFRLQVTNMEVDDVDGVEGFTVKCRPQSVRTLKERRGALVMSNVSPSEFVQRECIAAGVAHIAQPCSRRPQIARDVPEPGQTYSDPHSPWTTFQRLADEVGFVCFEAADIVYFGQPTWLINQDALAFVNAYYKTGDEAFWVNDVPRCAKSVDSPETTVDVT